MIEADNHQKNIDAMESFLWASVRWPHTDPENIEPGGSNAIKY